MTCLLLSDLVFVGDTENQPAGHVLEAAGKSGTLGLAASKSALGLGGRTASRGLRPHNELVRA